MRGMAVNMKWFYRNDWLRVPHSMIYICVDNTK